MKFTKKIYFLVYCSFNNLTKNKINKHVHDNVLMNVDLMMMMTVAVVVVVEMVNNDVYDYHDDDLLDHDPLDHDLHDHRDLRDHLDLLNVDFVVDIVSLLHHDHKSIDPKNDKRR
jgi:hypothetical protein